MKSVSEFFKKKPGTKKDPKDPDVQAANPLNLESAVEKIRAAKEAKQKQLDEITKGG